MSEDRVDCAECGERYDSAEFTFCPRCGGTGARPAGAKPTTAGGVGAAPTMMDIQRSVARRRVQRGGIILVAMGAATAAMLIASLFLVETQLDASLDALATQAGGDLEIQVLGPAGDPAVGVNVTLLDMEGSALANGTTGAGGWWNTTAPQAGVNVTALDTWQRAFALGGQTLPVTLDATATPDDAWISDGALVTGLRIYMVVLLAMTLFVVGGGIAALRLKGRRLAVSGAFMGSIPAVLMALATLGALPMAATLFLVAAATLMVVATMSIWRGRTLFAS
ncbi:MAG: hypothetical protein ACPGQL_03025 [Thermoplasmatota archaeon]